MTDNKRISNKQIMDKLIKIENSKLNVDQLVVKIVSRMIGIQTMQTWHEHVRDSPIAEDLDAESLDMTEEEEAISDAAKYMTLMNLFEDKEEYEKCAICKIKLDRINKIIRKGNE